MEAEPCREPAIVVQIVGWTGIVCPTVQVLIDGLPVGVLSDRRARSLSVSAGVHRMATKVGWLRSRPLVLKLAPADRVSLECGFHRWRLTLPIPLIALVTTWAGMLLTNHGLYLEAMAANGLAIVMWVANLMMTVAMPGACHYLKRREIPLEAGALPERMDPASPAARPERDRRGFQFGLRGLLILVACCAPLFWMGREVWDRRPANQTARAFRMLRSGDPSARLSGASDLRLLVMINSLTPKEVDDAIPDLLVALRDQNPGVREAAAGTLHWIVFEATQRSAPVPRVQAVAAGLAGGLRDTVPAVRHDTGLALAQASTSAQPYWGGPARHFRSMPSASSIHWARRSRTRAPRSDRGPSRSSAPLRRDWSEPPPLGSWRPSTRPTPPCAGRPSEPSSSSRQASTRPCPRSCGSSSAIRIRGSAGSARWRWVASIPHRPPSRS